MTHHQKLDWQAERANFPACEKFVYYMGAANCPFSKPVYEAQRQILDLMHFEAHTSWEGLTKQMQELRARLARLFGGQALDWGFGANSSHNMNLLAAGLKARLGSLEVLSFDDEFPSSTIAWRHHGHQLRVLSHDQTGALSLDLIEAGLTQQTKVLVISHVQYSTGFRADLEALGKLLAERQILFVVNATQSLGVHPLNVERAHIDALVCSSHKWLGAGYGASLLYTSEKMRENLRWPMAGTTSFQDPSFKGDLVNPRPGTAFIELGAMPFMQLLGVDASTRELERLGVDNIQARVLELSEQLQRALKNAGVMLEFDRDQWPNDNRSQLIFAKVQKPDQVEAELRAKNILVNNRRGLIRIAVHFANNLADQEALIAALKAATK